jgi:UDP-N-acetylglucosamine 2-epimerase (non-hydrolysing)
MHEHPRSALGPRLVSVPASPSHDDEPATIVLAAGDRWQLLRLAPIIAALNKRAVFRPFVVDLGTVGVLEPEIEPAPPVTDGTVAMAGSTFAHRTAAAIVGFERIVQEQSPTLVVVVDGGEDALACALAASGMQVPVAHVEAGLRTWDWSQPAEVSRVLTDRISDLLLTQSAGAAENLLGEGIDAARVHTVGSTLIDVVRRCERRARDREAWRARGAHEREYVLAVLRRPDRAILEGVAALGRRTTTILALDAITREEIEADGTAMLLEAAGVDYLPAFGYLDLLSLEVGAGAIVTNAGPVQEEASALGVACFTIGSTTERLVTLTHGTNTLLGDDPGDIAGVQPSPWSPTPCAIPFWDGRAGERMADLLAMNYALVGARA